MPWPPAASRLRRGRRSGRRAGIFHGLGPGSSIRAARPGEVPGFHVRRDRQPEYRRRRDGRRIHLAERVRLQCVPGGQRSGPPHADHDRAARWNDRLELRQVRNAQTRADDGVRASRRIMTRGSPSGASPSPWTFLERSSAATTLRCWESGPPPAGSLRRKRTACHGRRPPRSSALACGSASSARAMPR